MSRPARRLAVLSFCILLATCGPARQAIEEQAAEPASASLNDALAECRNAFPDQIAQAVARASCVIKATELVRPLLPFPDLLDRENALRKSLAEQVQGGTVSLLERNIQIQKLHAQLLDEERSRPPPTPAASGKPPLAVIQWRQSNPESCGRLGGDSTSCY
ncbi:hypothetical protein J6500_12775 [Bradyrhizobium sp. WSM 1704]|uniref:hypothetical protein n=1 Tax=Bradyrhizobium semiaridum TaxID=2821404 RepID=UPI001CE2C9C7|nr:hypothetical protein [Bradyrhizobium semiaridum]MCA6122763.1 hypothetical protein [Bradyrhizobium semiaridum]